jgi:hypothetical protein
MEEIKDFLKEAGQAQRDDITFYPFIGDDDQSIMLDGYRNLAIYLRSQDVKQIWIKPTRPYPYFFERTGRNAASVLASIKRWVGTQTDDIMEIREKISFKVQGNRTKWLQEVETLHHDVDKFTDLTFTDTEWQSETEPCMRGIFDEVGLKIHEDKIVQWRRVASEWQDNLERLAQWYEKDSPMIAEMIIQGKDFDLTPYGLDFVKEAVLMSHVMGVFGRRLMVSTEEFPKNTKDLHQLLK